MPVNILIVTDGFTLGGLETSIRGEISNLSQAGCNVHMAVGRQFSDALIPDELKSLSIDLPIFHQSTIKDLIDSVDKIREIIRKNQIDIIHAHPFMSFISSAIAANLERKPLVVSLHGPASLASYYGPVYDFFISSFILSQSEMVVNVSEEISNISSIFLNKNKSIILRNSVMPLNISNSDLSEDDSIDSRWLCVSRLDSQKNIGILDFVKKAKAIGLNGVVIVGDGPDKLYLQDEIEKLELQNYVEFYGISENVEEMITSYSGVAGMGRVVLEGINCSKPVILIGYDGVKGVVDETLIRRSAVANFSGRNIETITAELLLEQLKLLSSDVLDKNKFIIHNEFNEYNSWQCFLAEIKSLKYKNDDFLNDLYHLLKNEQAKFDEVLLQSETLLSNIGKLVCSYKYYDEKLFSIYWLCRKNVDSKNQMELKYEIINTLTNGLENRDQLEIKTSIISGLTKELESRDQLEIKTSIISGLTKELESRDQLEIKTSIISNLTNMLTEYTALLAKKDEHISELKSLKDSYQTELIKADKYRSEKENHIARLEMELRSGPVVTKIKKIASRIKRIPSYANRSLKIINTKGYRVFITMAIRKINGVGNGHVNNYIISETINPASSLSTMNDIVNKGSIVNGEIVIICGVPFDDIGSGQRAAQLARCALKTGRKVTYIYIYKKFDFEKNEYVDSNVNIHGMQHVHIESCSAINILKSISSTSVLVVELPHPAALEYLQLFNNRGISTVFELIDDWETSLGGDWFNIDIYRKFVAESSVVVGTAKLLVERLKENNRPDALYLPNAANEYIFDKYKKYTKPSDFPANYKKTALYFGSLYGEWFAWDYINEAAVCNSDIAFVLIGDRPSDKNLPKNVIFLGAKNIEELPAYLWHSDLALLPFTPGTISDAVSPIKVFEYLFLGKPVVATKMPELVGYPGVLIAESPKEFSELCKRADSTSLSHNENDLFIASNSWFSRLDKIVAPIPDKRYNRTVSAIILIHNNKNIIDRCLTSLISHCEPYLHEIIIVDNMSEDGSVEHITEHYPSVKVLRNTVNGCSSGRNLGAKIASGKYLAFFDSDQWFTSSSCFEEALSLLMRDANVGAIGWAAGWFDSTRDDLGGMITDYCPNRAMNSTAILNGYRSDIGYLGTGGFFVPRVVYDATDGFDISYDPTCFEDTDLSFQVKKLGLDVCYRDLTGIRHQPHQTTKANSNSDKYTNLFTRNAEYFKNKWADYPEFYTDYTEE